MANKYEGLPKKIFGLTCPQHRAQRVREFLTHNNVPFRQRATKVTLLKHLVVQQNGLTPDEEHAISLWFLGFEDRRVVKYRQVSKTTLVHRSIQKGSANSTTKSLQAKQSLPAECSVCMESLLGEQFPQKRLAASCAHKPTICLKCLAQSLQHQIEEKPWDHVACPECPERLSFEVVKKFATKASFERYDKKSVLAAFQGMTNFTMCLGPNCGSGQIHGGGNDQPIMTCTSCQFKTCFTHKMPWHAGKTCEQYDIEQQEKRTQQEAASAAFLAKETKICPNKKCGLHVDKWMGCDHVTCTVCNFEFCWRCLASYKRIRREGNTAHSRKCKYHTH